MATADRPPVDLNTNVPRIAGIYDYWLGGKDNYFAGPLTIPLTLSRGTSTAGSCSPLASSPRRCGAPGDPPAGEPRAMWPASPANRDLRGGENGNPPRGRFPAAPARRRALEARSTPNSRIASKTLVPHDYRTQWILDGDPLE
ncbi:MAG TPA: hypothetical protein VF069_06720 [Streptosporangiaceae bacterium]